eukprot:2573785-Pyramimonas_sp.AAC.1
MARAAGALSVELRARVLAARRAHLEAGNFWRVVGPLETLRRAPRRGGRRISAPSTAGPGRDASPKMG